MIRRMQITHLVLSLLIATSGISVAGGSGGFNTIAEHYEEIRLALLRDTTAGVADHASRIRQAAVALEREFDASEAAVSLDRSDECREILPVIEAASRAIEAATSIEDTRESFGELSRALVQCRQLQVEPLSIVVHCSMAEQVWVQPEGEIGNPYYGQSMARCGEIVSD